MIQEVNLGDFDIEPSYFKGFYKKAKKKTDQTVEYAVKVIDNIQ